jgi:hypothetical protein
VLFRSFLRKLLNLQQAELTSNEIELV